MASASSAAELPAPVTWQPQGGPDTLRWAKKPKTEEDTSGADDMQQDAALTLMAQRQIGVMSAKLQKKQLDKEVPYKMIPPEHLDLYHEA